MIGTPESGTPQLRKTENDKLYLDITPWTDNFKKSVRLMTKQDVDRPHIEECEVVLFRNQKGDRLGEGFKDIIRFANYDEMQIIAELYRKMHEYQMTDGWQRQSRKFHEKASEGGYDSQTHQYLKTQYLMKKLQEFSAQANTQSWIKDAIGRTTIKPREYLPGCFDASVYATEGQIAETRQYLKAKAAADKRGVEFLLDDEKEEILRKGRVSNAIYSLFDSEQGVGGLPWSFEDIYEEKIRENKPVDLENIKKSLS